MFPAAVKYYRVLDAIKSNYMIKGLEKVEDLRFEPPRSLQSDFKLCAN